MDSKLIEEKEESPFIMSFYSWKDPNIYVYRVWYSVYDNYLGLSQNYDKKLNCRGIKWQMNLLDDKY